MKNLKSAMATHEHDGPIKNLKESADLFVDFLQPPFNECIKTRKFPSCLKQADNSSLQERLEK